MNLSSNVSSLKYINENYARLLEKLGIVTLKDLLTYFPRNYSDTVEISNIADLVDADEKEIKTIKVTIEKITSVYLRNRKTLQTANVFDSTGKVKCVWFNQQYLVSVMKSNTQFLISGKVKHKPRSIEFVPTDYEPVSNTRETIHLGRISPIYQLTAGVSKKWIRNRIKSLIDLLQEGNIKVSNELEKVGYNANHNITEQLEEVHFPSGDEANFQDSVNTLSLMELTNVHLQIKNKENQKKKPEVVKLKKTNELIENFVENLDFEPTKDQLSSIRFIATHLSESTEPLNILLQGDVGSGKTVIAIFLAYIAFMNGIQFALIVPTTVLAKQHFGSFTKLFEKLDKKAKIILQTSMERKVCGTSCDIIIGTTAVLARKDEIIKKLGFLVVDEQHRFGVEQRDLLLKYSDTGIHFMSMTATPIPRTIAETFFSNMKVLTLKTKPKNRIPIKTFIVPKEKKLDSYKWIQEKVSKEKIQVYWVCPLIELSEKTERKAVHDMYSTLTKFFPKLRIQELHGKLANKEKLQTMEQFTTNKVDILVSTTVIEVGVDVANATIIVIEDADNFGLAQLHQIRGRVGRGTKQSYCLLFQSERPTDAAERRLKFLRDNTDGLKIAQFDLEMRGPGEVYGTAQSGIPNLKIAKLNNLELLRESKSYADKLIKLGIKNIELFS